MKNINKTDKTKRVDQAPMRLEAKKPSRFKIDRSSLLVTEGPSVTWQDETCTRKA